MTKVLHLTTSRLFGGVERFLLNLVRRRDLSPDLELQFGVFYEGRFTRELDALGIKWVRLGSPRWSRPWTVWNARRRLARHLRENGFDVVVSHGGWTHSIASTVIKRAHRPQVLWQHDASPPTHWIQRLASRHAPNLLIANSQFTLSAAKRVFPDVPAVAILLPIELAPTTGACDTVRADYGTSADDVVILQASRFEGMKGHEVLLEALAQLTKKKLPAWKCWIASEPQQPHELALKAQLEKIVAARGLTDRVKFLGHHSDMPALYAAADIYCQPNLGPEAFGIVFAESMLAKLPLVTSHLGGATELADAECAIWTEVGSAASVASALESLISDPARRAQMGQHGFTRATALCDAKTQMGKIEMALLRLKVNS